MDGSPSAFVRSDETLAYLAGMMDGDGYLKLTRNTASSPGSHPYFGATIGVQQLAPGVAVHLFAAVFGGHVMPPAERAGARTMARCEVHTRKAVAATRRLLPYLLVKREQALLLLEVERVRATTSRRSAKRHQELAAIHDAMLTLHDGQSRGPEWQMGLGNPLAGYEALGPADLGWTRNQIFAYLAGIMDSDGSFRIEKRNVSGMLHPHFRINVRCSQVAPSPAIELLSATFGGRLGARDDGRRNSRPLVVWSLHDRAAATAVKSLLPFLQVKKSEAWLLLQLRWLKEQGKKGVSEWVHANRWHDRVRMRKRFYAPCQVAAFERIYHDIQDLHSGRRHEPAVAWKDNEVWLRVSASLQR